MLTTRFLYNTMYKASHVIPYINNIAFFFVFECSNCSDVATLSIIECASQGHSLINKRSYKTYLALCMYMHYKMYNILLFTITT